MCCKWPGDSRFCKNRSNKEGGQQFSPVHAHKCVEAPAGDRQPEDCKHSKPSRRAGKKKKTIYF